LEQSLDILIDDVKELVEEGALKPIQGFFLILRLRIAQRQLEIGRPRAALFLLEKFIYHVEALIEDGSLAASAGQPLIAAALGIIDDIKQ